MNDVKLYTFTLLCAALASALLNIAAPKKQQKQLEYITGLFLLICVISPLTNVIGEIDLAELSPPDAEIRRIDTDKIIEKEFSNRLQKIIEQKLNSVGIMAEDIRIEITISQEMIEQISVLITLQRQDEENINAVKALIQNELGLDAEIQIAGG